VNDKRCSRSDVFIFSGKSWGISPACRVHAMNRGTISVQLLLMATALVGCAARSAATTPGGPVAPVGDHRAGATPPNMDLRFDLFVDHVPRSVTFYKHVLGFEVDGSRPTLCRCVAAGSGAASGLWPACRRTTISAPR
jgi:hypothetical protein